MGEKGSPVWQQSQQINSQAYFMAYSQMLNIALSRFRWLNLPKTCNAWFLEYNLLYYGYATIAYPHSKPGVFFPHRPSSIPASTCTTGLRNGYPTG